MEIGFLWPTRQLSKISKLSPQINTSLSYVLCHHSCVPEKDFSVGHPSPNYSGPNTCWYEYSINSIKPKGQNLTGGCLASNPTDTMAEARRSLAPRLSAWAPWPAAQRQRTPWLTTRTAPCMVECAFNGFEEQFRVRLVGYTKVSSQASIVQTGSFGRLNSTLSQTLVHLALYGLHNRERNRVASPVMQPASRSH